MKISREVFSLLEKQQLECLRREFLGRGCSRLGCQRRDLYDWDAQSRDVQLKTSRVGTLREGMLGAGMLSTGARRAMPQRMLPLEQLLGSTLPQPSHGVCSHYKAPSQRGTEPSRSRQLAQGKGKGLARHRAASGCRLWPNREGAGLWKGKRRRKGKKPRCYFSFLECFCPQTQLEPLVPLLRYQIGARARWQSQITHWWGKVALSMGKGKERGDGRKGKEKRKKGKRKKGIGRNSKGKNGKGKVNKGRGIRGRMGRGRVMRR